LDAGALSNTTIPTRISAFITKISKGNPKVIIYGFTFATCIISGFLSNFATLIMFYGIVLAFLKTSGRKSGESNLGRCLMISLPAAAGIGGFISPAGSPGNLIALSLLEKEGVTITFLHWFLMCTPFALLMSFLLCFFLCLIFKPEPLPEEAAEVVYRQREEIGDMNRKEKLALYIIGATVALWFASTWITFLPVVVVAGCAFFLMFMPGVDLMDWKSFVRESDWNLLFLIGSVGITMGCVNTTGAMTWIMEKLFSGVANLPTFALFLIIGLIIAGLRVTIPTAPAVAAIFIPVLIGIYHITGDNLVALSFIPVFWSGATMLLVYTEPIFLYTYGAGYYSAGDLFKVGIMPTIIMVIVMAAVYPAWFALFGY
jgi:sodium-dependent dicarboxylate transporter 2/3/5